MPESHHVTCQNVLSSHFFNHSTIIKFVTQECDNIFFLAYVRNSFGTLYAPTILLGKILAFFHHLGEVGVQIISGDLTIVDKSILYLQHHVFDLRLQVRCSSLATVC